jgi:hypothetical protein
MKYAFYLEIAADGRMCVAAVPYKRTLIMNKYFGWIRLRLGWVLLLIAGVFGPATAFADTYTIYLKTGSPATTLVPTTCAVGSFTFTKSGAGSFLASSPTVTIFTNNCVASLGADTYNSTTDLLVHVDNVNNGQDQGLNVVGISGTLRHGGDQTERLVFSYSGTPSATPTGPVTYFQTNGNSTVGAYYVVNDKNLLVPEPGMLWLVLAALGALFMTRRMRSGSV